MGSATTGAPLPGTARRGLDRSGRSVPEVRGLVPAMSWPDPLVVPAGHRVVAAFRGAPDGRPDVPPEDAPARWAVVWERTGPAAFLHWYVDVAVPCAPAPAPVALVAGPRATFRWRDPPRWRRLDDRPVRHLGDRARAEQLAARLAAVDDDGGLRLGRVRPAVVWAGPLLHVVCRRGAERLDDHLAHAARLAAALGEPPR